MKFIIEDWAGNVCFFGQKFKTWDDAEEFLELKLGDSYEQDRGEYYILEKESKQSKLLHLTNSNWSFMEKIK